MQARSKLKIRFCRPLHIAQRSYLRLIQHCHSYFSSILGRITPLRREAIEERERMLQLSPPCISANIPSYASVATRNTTQTTTVRSIQVRTSFMAKPEMDGARQYSRSRQNDKHHTNAKNQRSSSGGSASRDAQTDDEWRKDRAVSTNRNKDSQNHIDWSKDRRGSREKSHHRKNSSERARSSSRDKQRTIHSPDHKHSPRRSPSTALTESCSMRSNKGVKSMKYVCYMLRFCVICYSSCLLLCSM